MEARIMERYEKKANTIVQSLHGQIREQAIA